MKRKTAGFSTNEIKLHEVNYARGHAANGSVRNLQKRTNLKSIKVKMFREDK